MEILKASRIGDELTLVIKLSPGTPSSTGKMKLVFTSGGWKNLMDNLKFNLTIGYSSYLDKGYDK